MKAFVLGLVPLLVIGSAAAARPQHHIVVLRDMGRLGSGAPIISGNNAIRINEDGEVISSPPPLRRSETTPPPEKPKP